MFEKIKVFFKAVAATLLSFSLANFATAQDCADGVCAVPGISSDFEVCSPAPVPAVKMIAQGKRLDSLKGKTIALVGGSFMANVTHPELKRLILAEYPSAKVYLLSEIGSAGPYPRPGVTRWQKDEFQQKLKDFKIDAVIAGNGGCGLCTPKEAGSCIAAEYLGIPAVMIAAPGFVTQARNTANAAGVPVLRVAEYPGAFSSHSREELLKNTREQLWPQIKNALTAPLREEEKMKARPQGTEIFSSLEEFQTAFAESGWTDGLPVIPPTKEAVAEFLRFTDLDPDFSLGAIPPSQREVMVRHVAVNGVMAGCQPEFMPILIAYVQAMTNGDFRRPLSSTHAWTPYCWLNGPLARQLGFDAGQGEISEMKNVRLGRFINLALINFGAYKVKENRMGTFGYLMPWTLVEDDAAAIKIGWKPHHMQAGFALNDSTITAASSINWGNNLVPATTDAEKIKDMIAWDAVEKSQMAVSSGMPCVYRVFLLTESVAKNLAAKYPAKKDFEEALIATARLPLDQRCFANYWGNPGSAFDPKRYDLERHRKKLASAESAQKTPTPPWLAWTGIATLETVPAMEKGKSAFIITGDVARNKELCVPGGGFVTIKINLPKNWNERVAERGYKPLENYFLKSDLTPDKETRPQRSRLPQTTPRGDFERRRPSRSRDF
ncbi:MAG: hypothetical protein K6B46_04365 [Opitutales bacterium]|nr:hypothetical protein [Opitutales bacterium]